MKKDNPQLERLIKVLDVFNEKTVSPEQLKSVMSAFVSVVKDLKASLQKSIKNTQIDHEKKIADVSKNIEERVKKATPIKGKHYFDGKEGKEGKPGKDAKGEKGDKGDKGDLKELSPQEVRDLLELLKDDERISYKSISGLEFVISEHVKNHPQPMLHPVALSNLPDVYVPGVLSGQTIQWNGTYWALAYPGGGDAIGDFEIGTLSGITDSTPDFTWILLPDTQHETSANASGSVAMWKAQYNWIIANKSALNIQAVISLGDITDDHTDTANQVALTGFQAMIAAGIQSLPGMGNHDYDNYADPRVTTSFDKWFGPAMTGNWTQYPWYEYDTTTTSGKNCAMRITIGSHKYLILSLQWDPQTADLAWGQSMINKYPGYEVFLMTHAYLNHSGKRTYPNDQGGTGGYYPMTGNDGQPMWDNFVKINPAIFGVAGGHFVSYPNTAYLKSVNNAGGTVHQFFADYQDIQGGNGWLQICTFSPSKGTITVSFYSPYLDEEDEDSPTYTISYQSPVITTDITTSESLTAGKNLSVGEVSEFNIGNGAVLRFNAKDPTVPVINNSDPAANQITGIVNMYMDENGIFVINAPKGCAINRDYGIQTPAGQPDTFQGVNAPAIIPKVTTAQRLLISNLIGGEMVFDTDIGGICIYNINVPGWEGLQGVPI